MLLDPNSIKTLREKLNAELVALGKEFNLIFKVTNSSYDRAGKFGHFKLEISTLGEQGEVVNKDAEAFKRLATVYGLKPENLGQTFLYGHKQMKIIGLKPRCSQYPLLVQEISTGKVFKLPANSVHLNS